MVPGPVYEDGERLFHGREEDDCVDRRAFLRGREPGFPGADGLGCGLLPVWNPGRTLVLDRGNSCNAFPGPHHDALLLHKQNTLGPGIPQAALR